MPEGFKGAAVTSGQSGVDLSRRTSVLRFAALLLACSFVAQSAIPAANAEENSLAALQWRSVGPVRGGRSIAVTGITERENEYYFGATGGGLWKSINGGQDWFSVGDGQFESSSVGAIGACQANPDTLYVGFGEVQLRGDIIPGDGVYRSDDGGKNWRHVGLESSTGQQTISRLRVHPGNCDLVYAAVFGDPFGPNEERGIYRSGNGGETWERILFRSDSVGASDLAISPDDPDTLYAGLWEAYRKPWYLSSGGDGSGMFKSADGGDTWTELTGNAGLPQSLWGKVAVSVSGADPDRVYANIEADDGGVFASNDGGATWEYVSADRNLRTRAFYYTRITADPEDVDTVYVNNEDFWRSRDGGHTWEEIAVPHGDNHDMWIDPGNNQRMIQANDGGANVSLDAGATWTSQDYATSQMYTVQTTSHFPYHVCGSQQDQGGGLCVPSDGNGSWWYGVGGGESGWVVPDPENRDIYYTGSQTTQLVRFDRSNGQLRSLQPWPIRTVGRSAEDVRERFQWTFPIAVSPFDSRELYAASQQVWKSIDSGRSWNRISPDLTYADPDTLGPSGGPITLDRTTVEHYGTLFSMALSRHDAQTIWTGSDDGRIHVTRDGGESWQDVTPPGLPKFSRVHFIEASPHVAGKAYAAVTRYRMQDIAPYIWKTEDHGRTWQNVVTGIASGDHVRAVVEDPQKAGLLFAGTENGVYVSLDDGAQWQSVQTNLPVSSIHALAIADNDLVAATHGRSFWILDDYSPLRQMTTTGSGNQPILYKPATSIRSNSLPTQGYERSRSINGANLYYQLRQPAEQVTVEILDSRGDSVRRFESTDEAVEEEDKHTVPGTSQGLHRVRWDLTYPGPATFPGMMWRFADTGGPTAPPGDYEVKLIVDEDVVSVEQMTIGKDPRLEEVSDEDLLAQFDLGIRIRDRTSDANEAVLLIRGIKQQVERIRNETTNRQILSTADRLWTSISDVESAIYEVRLEAKEDQLNYGVKLNNDLAVLLLEVDMGDGRPTEQEYAVFEILSEDLEVLLNDLDSALDSELSALNTALERDGFNPVRKVPPQ